MVTSELPSKSKVRRCGEILRAAAYEPDSWGDSFSSIEEVVEARRVVNVFRRAHQLPMTKVRVGLTSMVGTIGADPVLTQRLKRTPRIIRKLQRSSGAKSGRTMLDRLEDIGGVRVILPDQDHVRRLSERINQIWTVRRERDYVAEPQSTGYWARHIIVVRDERFIEIQLRTPLEQSWADAVEAADSRLGLTLKDGNGPESMRSYFALAAKQLRARELGERVNTDTMTAFLEAREQVVRERYYRK